MSASPSLEKKLHCLELLLSEMGTTLIAFSGGIDSSFLLTFAAKACKEKIVALMTVSSSTPPQDEQQATELVTQLDVPFIKIQHNELAISEYAANPPNRCYFCKESLYSICQREAKRLSLQSIADGVNVDDLSDYRPGLQAASEYNVSHPLVASGFTKADIRQGSKLLGLQSWNRPASPCLASRIPYGNEIKEKMLFQIAEGETYIRSLGFREVRLRHHGEIARVEISTEELSLLKSSHMVVKMKGALKELGFSSVLLDMGGYRTGVFNPTPSSMDSKNILE